ncbi:MAG: DUF3035 domain-containing protein [Rickettsiales bacterium]
MKQTKYSLALISLLILNGCGISKSSLGFGKASPNEYSVLRQEPLVVPPGIELVAPKDEPESKEVTEEEFDKIFYGDTKAKTTTKSDKLSKSDKSFLKKTKGYNKKSDIKKLLKEETKQQNTSKKEKKQGLFSKWFGK